MLARNLEIDNNSDQLRDKLFYMALGNLNSDPAIYRGSHNGKKAQSGYFYMCWIDQQGCLHHFKNGSYRHPYSSKNILDLITEIHNNPKRNWFIAPNTFRSDKIRDVLFTDGRPNVRTITSFYIDFDVMNSGISMGQFYQKLPVILDRCHVVPNAIIRSGHGYHVYILLNQGNPVNSPKIVQYWTHIEADIVGMARKSCLKIFGKPVADHKVKDISRILRSPGSFNMKNPDDPLPVKVEYLDLSDRPSFKDVQNQWENWFRSNLNIKRTKRDLARHHYRHRSTGHTTRTLNRARCRDLFTLAALRKHEAKQDGRSVGYRDLVVFYYATCALRPNFKGLPTYSDSQTIKNLLSLNERFYRPLKHNQIWHVIYELPKIHQMIRLEQSHKVRKTRYCPSNQRMIKDLDITDHEQYYMATIISHGEAKRRKPINYRRKLLKQKHERKLGRIRRDAKRNDRNNKIMKLHEIGLSIRKIAKQLNTSRTTVSRVTKQGVKRCPKTRAFKSYLTGQVKRVKKHSCLDKHSNNAVFPKDNEDHKDIHDIHIGNDIYFVDVRGD